MERNDWFFSFFITSSLLHLLILSSETAAVFAATASVTRDDFPPGFIFGAGTSAYQVEGAVAEDGRKPSVWDTYALTGKNLDHSSGDIAADQYHKYKEDVRLMHDMGLDAYRFSISWSRLIPDGRGPVNPKGLQYYNNLIDELLSFGIEPHVTLCHFDLPQALEDEYQGLLSRKIIDDFAKYADTCFKEFGDRVKYWITFNEPNIEAVLGHDLGIFPPARCSSPYGLFDCSGGDSTTEPYRFAHNVLLSHASAAALYKVKYQSEQGGQIGITILGFWFEPFTNSSEDVAATNRMRDFHIGWMMGPLINGDYPGVMREAAGSRLPTFSSEESERLKASFDFIGVNHYIVVYLQSYPNNIDKNRRDYLRDVSVTIGGGFPGLLANLKIQDKGAMPSIDPVPISPWSLQRVLEYIKVTYGNPPIMIHENGDPEFNVGPTTGNGTDDTHRVVYLEGYLESLLQAVRNGSNTRGYFVWSFTDCFELMFGYTARYGLYGVDFNGAERRRYPRLSAHWYSEFLTGSRLESRASRVSTRTD